MTQANPNFATIFCNGGVGCHKGNRIVKQDRFAGILVSTVFLGLDHNYGDGLPLLWETMIFNGEHDQYQERYSSKEGALAGHQEAVALVRGFTKDQFGGLVERAGRKMRGFEQK